MNRFNLVLGQGISRPPTPKVSGMLEVIAPEDGFVLEKCMPLSRRNSLGRTDAVKEQKNWQNGRLHVFGPKEKVVIEPVQTAPRIGCRKESTSRPYTPSKQILLCTAKSLEKSSNNQNPKTTVNLHKDVQEDTKILNDPHLKDNLRDLNHETEIIEANTESKDGKEETLKNVEETPHSVARTETQESSVDKQNAGEKSSDSSDDDECNHEQTDGEAEKRIAPLELMGEFLKAVMEPDYNLAKKLCQMILIYEPQNPEAKQFLPLIERKLQLGYVPYLGYCQGSDVFCIGMGINHENNESIQEADDEGTDEGSTDDSEEDTSDTEDSGTEEEESSEDSGT